MKCFLETYKFQYPCVQLQGWIDKSLTNDLIHHANSDLKIQNITFVEREDLAPLGLIQVSFQISLFDISFFRQFELFKLGDCLFEKSETIKLLEKIISVNYDFETLASNPATRKFTGESLFLAAFFGLNNSNSLIVKAQAFTCLIYRALDFNLVDDSMINIFSGHIDGLLEALAEEENPSFWRWYVCVLQAYVIWNIKSKNHNNAYNFCARILNGKYNNSYPSLATNCIYLLFYLYLYEIKLYHRSVVNYISDAVMVFKKQISAGDLLLHESYNEIGNAIIPLSVMVQISNRNHDEKLSNFVSNRYFTSNWMFVKDELIEFLET